MAITVTPATTDVPQTASSMVVQGTGFDAATPGNNRVLFSPSGAGQVVLSTATRLTLTGLSNLTVGALYAVVNNPATNQSSGSPVQVGVVSGSSTGYRTTVDKVQALLGKDYDATFAADLGVHVGTASTMVDDLVTYATTRGVTLSAAKLELIERWLAAYSYTKTDRIFKSRSQGGSGGGSASFAGAEKPYWDQAVQLDTTGFLLQQEKRKVVSMTWLGSSD